MLRAELSPAQSSRNDDRREEAALWAALFGHNISSGDSTVWRTKSFFPHSCLAPAAASLGAGKKEGAFGRSSRRPSECLGMKVLSLYTCSLVSNLVK